MDLNSFFTDFLATIRLPNEYAEECRKGHETLRQRLEEDPKLAPIIVSTFLQGSYRRGTAICPNHEQKADVDVVLVTKLSKEEYSPEKVFLLFTPFLDKYYPGQYKFQGRSIGISLKYVDLDLVIAAAPSESEFGILKSSSVVGYETLEEAGDWMLNKDWLPVGKRPEQKAYLTKSAGGTEEWKSLPLYIPDREARVWEPTHPLAQIQWTRDKNARCNGHYVNVVKVIKWWHRAQKTLPKYPKGYLIEHLVGTCCPDGIQSVAEGVTRTLEAITLMYKNEADQYRTPYCPDHGVPEHNVFRRVSGFDFAAFYGAVTGASRSARQSYDSNDVSQSAIGWRKLFGDSFPTPPPNDSNNKQRPDKPGFTPRVAPTVIGGGRFA